jgi:hypothetical protein
MAQIFSPSVQSFHAAHYNAPYSHGINATDRYFICLHLLKLVRSASQLWLARLRRADTVRKFHWSVEDVLWYQILWEG